jgi:hypothetical protein
VGPRTVPSLGSAFRAAAVDIYFQSIRVVPANVAWGACLLALLACAVWVSPTLALAAAPLLVLPLVAIARLAAQTVRGEDVVLSDGVAAIRAHAVPALLAGLMFEVAAIVFAINAAAGVAAGGPVGWGFATLAAWGLIGTWVLGLAFWPLLVDPAREVMPVRERARLAGVIIVAEPLRFAGLGAAIAVVTVLSTVAFPALLSVSVAFMALVAARVVLPAADRLEMRPVGPAATSESAGQV